MCPSNTAPTPTPATTAAANHRRSAAPSSSPQPAAASLSSSAQTVVSELRSRVRPGHQHLTSAAAAAQEAAHAANTLSSFLSVAWAAEGLDPAVRRRVQRHLNSAQHYLARVQAALAELDAVTTKPTGR